MLPAADPQAVGSAITYLRRYGLAAMVGVAPEDDDGEATSRPVPQSARQVKPFAVNDAGEFIVPGAKEKWDGHGGKAITDQSIPVKVLGKCREFFIKTGDGKAQPLIVALEEELERRREADEAGLEPVPA